MMKKRPQRAINASEQAKINEAYRLATIGMIETMRLSGGRWAIRVDPLKCWYCRNGYELLERVQALCAQSPVVRA